MKRIAYFIIFSISLLVYGQDQKAQAAKPQTLKSILLLQLQEVHNKEEWFVPANIAVEGLTAEQANWTDGKGNHSAGQLAYHLAFWNKSSLARMKGEQPPKFSGNNDETFTNFDAKQWADTVKQLDQSLTELEKLVENAGDSQLNQWAPTIEKIATHNAYHIGQIIFVRKQQGSWNPEKGVK